MKPPELNFHFCLHIFRLSVLALAVIQGPRIGAATSMPIPAIIDIRLDSGDSRPDWLKVTPAEVRSRMARIDLGPLSSAAKLSNPKNQIFVLHPFEDLTIFVAVTRVEWFGDDRFVIHGVTRIEGAEGKGDAMFSFVDGTLHADLTLPDGRQFSIRYAGEASCIIQIDPSKEPFVCGSIQPAQAPFSHEEDTLGPRLPRKGVDDSKAMDHLAPKAATTTPIIDVMILYTPAVLSSAGSVAAVEARAQAAISYTNEAFLNSEINAQARLAATVMVNYTESGSLHTDLDRLRDSTDGFMDDVPALRVQHSADAVHLFVAQATDAAGVADGRPGDNLGVEVASAVPGPVFAHEFGHNFGCDHDRPNAFGNAPFPYSYGYSFTGNNGVLYGDVLSYAGQTIPYYSNPNVLYNGVPTGVGKDQPNSADNVRTINNTAAIVANTFNGGIPSRIPVSATRHQIGFPVVPVGESAYDETIIQNETPAPLTISGFHFTGDAENFHVQLFDYNNGAEITGDTFTLAAYNDVRIAFTFTPQSDRLLQAQFVFGAAQGPLHYSPVSIPLVGNASHPSLRNISTRLQVGVGDNVLIAGIIVGGTTPRRVILRAIGPSLAAAGVTGALKDPVLEVYHGQTLLAQNDEWGSGLAKAAIVWSDLPPPTDELESAIELTLDPGDYTAIVRGFAETTGVALVEAYDLDSTPSTEFLNISTRGDVKVGDNVLIGGFIVGGSDEIRVLVRALGPSLPVPGALADPVLELHDSNGTLFASNDDWRDTQQFEIQATTIPPTKDAESAIVSTLAPGAYTAIVHGKSNGTGVALVEAYRLEN